jgi:nicotinamide riboside kinase
MLADAKQQYASKPLTTEIYVVGPSSTGKTTLCDVLARKLGLTDAVYVREVARTVMHKEGFTREDVGRLEMQKAIMTAQLKREEESRMQAAMGSQILLSDRSAVDPIVYAVLTADNKAEAQKRRGTLIQSSQIQFVLEKYRHAVFVLLAPVPEWVKDDGVRSTALQAESMEIFRQTLSDLKIRYREIGPEMRSLDERVRVVMGLARLKETKSAL